LRDWVHVYTDSYHTVKSVGNLNAALSHSTCVRISIMEMYTGKLMYEVHLDTQHNYKINS